MKKKTTKVKLPKKIPVGGHKYEVKYPYKFKEDSTVLGMCDWLKLEIQISSVDNNNPIAFQRTMTVFLHELIHAVDFIYNRGSLSNEAENNEKMVDALAFGLYDVFSNNKVRLNSLTSKIPKFVMVGSLKYDIIYPYAYETLSSNHLLVDLSSQKIRIGADKYKNNSILMASLIQALLFIILDHNMIHYDLRELRGLANGLYQAFKDIDVENLIKINK